MPRSPHPAEPNCDLSAPRRRPLLAALGTATLLALAGCAQPRRTDRPDRPDRADPSDRTEPADRPEPPARRGRPERPGRPDGGGETGPAGHAYAPVAQLPHALSRHHWPLAGAAPVAITLARPAAPGPWPLVLYLPGLGETAESGATWRLAWAAAGYAVLSAQVLDDDALAWRSDLARAGEFDALARRHLGPTLMARRLAAWQALLAEVRQRAASGEAPWTDLDLSRSALAGHELGAASALQLARAEPALRAGLSPQAVLLFSPYEAVPADAARAAEPLAAAVLGITGPADADPLGLLPSHGARLALFARLTAAQRSLLTLDELPHGLLGGTLSPAAEAVAGALGGDGRTGGGAAGDRGGTSGSTGGRRRGSGGGMGSPGTGGGMSGGPGRGAGRDPDGTVAVRGAPGTRASSLQRQVIAAQDVSTAWLDARVRGDAGAQDWLLRKAPAWLAGMGAALRD